MATVKVNQVAYDFYSMEVEVSANGESFGVIEGLEEIEYTTTINREKLYGRSRVPIERTDGDAEFDGSITIHRYWYNYLVKLAKELGIGLAQLEMTFAITYAADGETVTDTLTRVKLGEIGNSHSRSPDPLQVTLPLDLMNVYYDGVDVFGAKLAA